MACEMCGKEPVFYIIELEGTQLRVCEGCSEYGSVVSKIKSFEKPIHKPAMVNRAELIEIISDDYSSKIRIGRNKKGITQEDMAKQINEKLSVLHNVEAGHMMPSMAMARKLEKYLGISLVESVENVHLKSGKDVSEGLTLGDFIKKKVK